MLLNEPQPLTTKVPKLNGLDGRKMSSLKNTISLIEEDDELEKSLIHANRPFSVKKTDAGDPEKCSVWNLHKILLKMMLKYIQEIADQSIGLLIAKILKKNISHEILPIRERL